MCSARPGDVRVHGAVRVRRLVAVVDVELAGLRVEVGDHPARLERRRVAARVDDVARRRSCRPRRTRGRSASSSPASHVGLARLSTWPSLSSRISGASGSSALRALTTAGSGSYSTSISDSASRAEYSSVGDHERDLLALEADLVAGEHGLRVVGDRRHPRQAERLEVLGGDDRGDVRVRERLGGVDRDDLRVRVRAAQDRAVHHPRQADVVEVGALAADEARVLLALQAAEADRALGRRAGRFSTVAMLMPPVVSRLRARPPSGPR